jgi:hypothetical protein
MVFFSMTKLYQRNVDESSKLLPNLSNDWGRTRCPSKKLSSASTGGLPTFATLKGIPLKSGKSQKREDRLCRH